ncbi:cadherin-like beta sandwich domain-containing protein [Amedibacterium intestinale]|uniref:Cadherin-like beta-sandwich-like domain-containing protein n=1 Tax=Amedibacterium intestinale TaxID=2583452 RepID=A0A6N4TI08_9FIRM|nr:cadherin-like beta sandwich domain-containing protein [Amedibacterium intestinale]RHO30403.1 hypothetical protein DW208_05480 [Erysipelotrichaceae bacterium AM17-60]BBK22114.1 hypothetical protein Aargi30884_10170 [Amedibacterium intestinale]BBK62198.1 hypothetical protein A9CBEGH2_11380 [Amedibacterium intestinale]
MKRIMKKICIWAFALTVIVSVLGLPVKLFAAGGLSVSASAGSVYVGDSVTFTVSASNSAGNVNISGAVNDSIWLDNSSQSYTVKATSAGTIGINVSGVLASYDTGLDQNVSGSSYVTVMNRPTSSGGNQNNTNQNVVKDEPKEEVKKNTDSALASLSVSQGKLSPNFASGTTSYKVTLPSTASSIKISASARDAKASVSGAGTRELEPGNNKLSVVCSAEDGSSTTYTINVYVDEKPLTYMTYNGVKFGVSAHNGKGGKLSKAFDETKIKVDGIEIPAWKNNALNITLVYLQSEGTEGYYIYDETKQEVVSVYEPMAVLGQNIVRIDVPENLQKREGMNFTKVKVDGKEFTGWTFDDKNLENYALIYVMNDAGKYVYYQYEKTQNTLQLYSGSAPLSQEAFVKYKEDMEKKLDNSQMWNVIFGIAAGIFAVGMIVSIVMASKRKGTSLKYERVNMPARKMSKASNIEADSLMNKFKDKE